MSEAKLLTTTGMGLKIPQKIFTETLVTDFLKHMDKFRDNSYGFVLGLDSQYCDEPHYHLHFIGSLKGLAVKTVQNHKNKFPIKDPAMKFYVQKAEGTVYQWLAYAVKESIVTCGGEIDRPLLENLRMVSLEKKKKDFEKEKKDLEEKDLKKELYNIIVEYFEKNCLRVTQVHQNDAGPEEFGIMVVEYYKSIDDVPRRQDIQRWQHKYFSKKWSAKETYYLIMGIYK